MTFKIKAYGEYPKLYNGTWLRKKPCTDAFTNGTEFLLSENDFTVESIYSREYTRIQHSDSPYNKKKFIYAEEWFIEINSAQDITNLINKVGSLKFITNDSVVIGEPDNNSFVTPFRV